MRATGGMRVAYACAPRGRLSIGRAQVRQERRAKFFHLWSDGRRWTNASCLPAKRQET